MSDDYLWDRTGPPDPEIERLEHLLRPLGQTDDAAPAAWGPAGATFHPAFTRRWRTSRTRGVLAAAAVLVLAIGGWWLSAPLRDQPRGWEIAGIEGSPTVGSRPIDARMRLAVGNHVETDANSRLKITVDNIGHVEIAPGSRVQVSGARKGDYRLTLERGTLNAVISAPPAQFFVETPSSRAVDLGCAYTLTVDDNGSCLIRVTAGWVAFVHQGREAFVPAGSLCATQPGAGPGTPYHQASSPAFRNALDEIDFPRKTGDVRAAVTRVLDESRERDEVTLWHLLTRAPVEERDRVFDRLATFVPPPQGVTREGVRAGRREMLDRWWDALGLGTISMWRRIVVQ